MKLILGSSLAATVVLLLAGCSASSEEPAGTRPSSEFDRLLHEITTGYFGLVPEMATYYGVPEEIAGRHAVGRLSHYGPEQEKDRRRAFKRLADRLGRVDEATLGEREATIREVLSTQLGGGLAPGEVAEYGAVFADYGIWYLPYPVTQLSGPHIRTQDVLEKQHAVRDVREAEAYLRRLRDYGRAIDEVIGKIQHDRELGVVPPDFVLEKAIGVIADRTAAEPAEHSLVLAFEAKLREAGLAPEKLVERARDVVQTVVLPANARLAEKLEELLPEATPDAGVWRLPGGEALYQALILHLADSTLTADEIHALGLSEVERITEEMDAILRREGYSRGTVGGRMAALGEEERFEYADTDAGKERIVADLNALMEEIAPRLPEWFGTLPTQGVVVKRVPESAEESSSGGFYDPPALDGSRPGTYWINLRDTAIWPSFSLKTLTYHEANPGHHLQTALGMARDAPILQNVLYSNAFVEGWALYAEALAEEMGLYEGDPWGDLGRLQDELHRAIRLVVDTGMHARRWSREEAVRYMIETEGAHPDEAEAEVDRYVVWPGQALGYKIGMLEIRRLREEARRVLGDRFDIRAFHDVVLEDGGVPLLVLREKIERWIEGLVEESTP